MSQLAGFRLLLVGFSLIFTGTILIMASCFVSGNSASTCIIIFVGPIPIMIGPGSHAFSAIFLATVLTFLCLLLFFFLRRKVK